MSFLSVELIFHGTSGDKRAPSSKRTIAIQVEVLNGTKEARIAERVRDVLRNGGFDVVDIGNYKASDVEKTLVIARTADREAAESVASFLGTDKNRVQVQPDKNLYLEVTVVVGRDITQLRSLK